MDEIFRFGEFDGIQLGVLIDGTPFATSTGLSVLCGVSVPSISNLGKSVPSVDDGGRAGKIATFLEEYEFEEDELYRDVNFQGQSVNAYTEPVCMAILEYYAFEAGERCTDKAKL